MFSGHLCGLMVKKLSDHIKRQHTERDIKKFVCEHCGDRFKGQSGYQFHLAGSGAY
jgi:transposase-like protein